MVSRRGFLKKLFGAGALAAGMSNPVFAKMVTSEPENHVDIGYVFQKINLKSELNEVECKVLFNYYIHIWEKYYFPYGRESNKKISFNDKRRLIKEFIEPFAYNFIAGLVYMATSRTNWYRENGFVLSNKFEKFYADLSVPAGLLKSNFLEDFRFLFLLLRDRYYSILVRKYIYENLGSILGDLNKEIEFFDKMVDTIKVQTLSMIAVNSSVDRKDYVKHIEDSIINYVYSKKNSDNIVLRLLRHVDKSGLEIYDIDLNNIAKTVKFKISGYKLNPQLKQMINEISLKYKINPTIVHLLCLIETSYGHGASVSHAGARGPIQVMPKTYERFTGKKNFKSASNYELIEAGIKNLLNICEMLDIDPLKKEFNYIELFMIGVTYNAGVDTLYNLVRKQNYQLKLEPVNYHQFLYLLHSHFIDFE